MKCAYIYCLYNRMSNCLLRKISIGITGNCADCQPMQLNLATFNEKKTKQLMESEISPEKK